MKLPAPRLFFGKRTTVGLAEFLKDRESRKKWDEINESEHEFITAEEQSHLDEVKAKGQFIDQDELLQELGITKDEIQN